jgi:hypothetical protein
MGSLYSTGRAISALPFQLRTNIHKDWTMAGQLIVLPGVNAAASAGAARIDMNSADNIAARIGTLKHAVSARSIVNVASGGVSGRCRATGAPLISKGANPTALSVVTIGGKPGLGLSSALAAGLALPAGSLTNSFTHVLTTYIGAADVASSSFLNLLSGFDSVDTYISYGLRYYGQAATGGRADRFVSQAPTAVAPEVSALRLTSGWNVVVIDYNNDTRLLSISVNQASSFATATKGASASFDAGSYLEIGYHLSINKLVDTKVGDLFTFSDSLLRSTLGTSSLVSLVAAIKSEYAIV